MKGESTVKEVDLGKCGSVKLHLSKSQKRLLVEFDTDPDGFDKVGLNAFIDALEKIRKRMDR